MKGFWNIIQLIFVVAGDWLEHFLGGFDGLLIVLCVFIIIDYVTGVMCAIRNRNMSGEVGLKVIFQKTLIFLIVGMASTIDTQILGTGCVLRMTVIFFYISNEGLSILEHATYLDLPIPEPLKEMLKQFRDHSNKESNKNDSN